MEKQEATIFSLDLGRTDAFRSSPNKELMLSMIFISSNPFYSAPPHHRLSTIHDCEKLDHNDLRPTQLYYIRMENDAQLMFVTFGRIRLYFPGIG